jgi:hypothetical protein
MPKQKALKGTLIILLSSIVTVFIAWQMLKELKIKAYVVDSINSELNAYFEDSVHFQMDDFYFRFLEKKIILEQVKINLIAVQKDTLASVELPNLSISWDNYTETFRDQFYNFRTLELKKAKVLLPFDFEKIKTTKAARPSFEGRFTLEIKDFLVEGGEILFYDEHNTKTGRVNAEYDLFAQDLKFNKGEIPNKFQDVASNIFLEFKNLTYYLPDSLHKVEIEKLAFNLFNRDVTLKKAHFTSIHSPEKFAQLKKEQANYLDISLDSIRLNTVRWRGDSMISINTIFTNQVDLIVRKDKNYPLPNDRFVPILVEQLKNSELSIDVRNLTIQNMNLRYFEIPNGTQEMGNVRISNIQGEIENITNRKDSIKKYGPYLVINASGDLYDEGKLTAEIRYNLNSKYGYFQVKGSLEPMSISKINQYMSKSHPVEVKSGKVDELRFNYAGGNNSVTGEMEFKYSDLKIQFRKILNEEEKGDKLLSWLANVALSQDNPKKNGRFRVGKIEFRRDTRKSMFSYWTNSLVSGFQSTVGMEKPAEIRNLKKEEKTDQNLWQKIGFGKDENGK